MHALSLGIILALSALPAAPQSVDLRSVSEKGIGDSIGEVEISQTEYGVVFAPKLKGLPPGLHGFHVHEKPNCGPGTKDGKPAAAQAAGGHYDPEGSNKHGAPWGDGHKGDLPALYVDKNGKAEQPVLAPRLTLAELKGRSLMIHAGADNHSDHPEPLGGGGKRLACGLIP